MLPPFELQLELQPICISLTTPDSRSIQSWVKTTLSYMHTIKPIKPCLTQPVLTLTVRIVDEAEMHYLNHTYRGKNKSTNVLSFPSDLPSFVLSTLDEYPLGDIILCASVIEQEAFDQKKIVLHHWAHMIVHGTLHLLGYDHEIEQEAKMMQSYEQAILTQLGFPNPYDTPQESES